MKFNTEVPFPPLWIETDRAWGQCDSLEELVRRIAVYYTVSDLRGTAEELLKRCKNAAYAIFDEDNNVEGYQHDYSNFGTRREHIGGNTTLFDFLVEKEIIEND